MPRSFLFAALIGFCGGIVLAEFWRASTLMILAALMIAIGLSWSRRWRFGSILIVACLIGLLRWQGWIVPTTNDLTQFTNQTILVQGDVLDSPTPRESQQEFVLTQIWVDGQRQTGSLSVRLPQYPAVLIGDRLTLGCTVTPFSAVSALRQRMHGLRGYCRNPEIRGRATAPNSLRLMLGRIKQFAIDRIARTFPEPQSSLLTGILLGRQVPMPPDIDQAFRATGTTHIIALSGFNVTMIITAISAACIKIIGRRWAWLPALLFVIGFVIMTGASASVTRAGVMSSFVVVALRIGRPVSMVRLLSYTLLAMVWHNPLVLAHDLGFQLSFLATLGLVYAAPAWQTWLARLPAALGIRENFSTTLGAITLTDPLLLWNFARVSMVAPLVNVIILPLIPLAMAAGFIALALPVLWPFADAVLRLVLACITWGAALPVATRQVSGAVAAMVGLGVTLIATLSIRKTHVLASR